MKFKIDENMPLEIAALLRGSGHDARTVVEQDLTGTPDADLVIVCSQEERILVTLDNDFADIRTCPPDKSPGFIVVRLNRQDKSHVLDVFAHAASLLQRETPERRLWIVEEDKIRIRG